MIKKLRKIGKKATEGPWGRYGNIIPGEHEIKPRQGSLEAAPSLSIGSVAHTEPICRVHGYLHPVEANSDFIATARNKWDALLDVVEEVDDGHECKWMIDYNKHEKYCSICEKLNRLKEE